MYKSKLYSILEHFNKYEQNRFRKYVSSPYFNKNETLVDLYEILIDEINTKKQVGITKESLWKRLIPDKGYDDVRFRKHCSDLLKHVEGYLAQQIYDENPLHQASYLIDAVSRKKMEKLYNSTMKSARRLSSQQIHKPASFYYYQYEIEKNYYSLAQHTLKRSVKSNVETIAKQLDLFYLGEKLRLYCEVINQQIVASHEYQLLFIDEIIGHVQKFDYTEIPPIAVYYQIYLTSTQTDNIDHYYKLKELLSQHGLVFPQNEALSLYYSAINYCIQKINKGNQNFLSELFDLYLDLVNKEIIFLNDALSPWDFKNIVVLALRLERHEWAENFVSEYYHRIPEPHRENARSYNLAQVYFYQKKYEKVIELLRPVEYEDPAYNLGSKAILLATYFETDEIEPLYSLFESFRVYLNRNKIITDNSRKNYKNLIKFTKKLTKLTPGDNTALKKIKEEIDQTKNIASKKWLKEKIAELQD